jgi:hypothetical protein
MRRVCRRDSHAGLHAAKTPGQAFAQPGVVRYRQEVTSEINREGPNARALGSAP